MYRFDGKQRNHTIGKYVPGRSDHVDRKAAMLAADEINTQIESSIDPKGKTKSTKPKPCRKEPQHAKTSS